jgi:hypothetical protein
MRHAAGGFEVNSALPQVQTRQVDGGGGVFIPTRQQPLRTLACKAATKPAKSPPPHHGGPRENGTRNGVGAIAAVGT